MAILLFFGDSIIRGENDGQRGGWVDRLKQHFMEKVDEKGDREVVVFNLGISGESTRGLSKRFKSECLARCALMRPNHIFLSYGANDLAKRKGRLQVPVDQYTHHLADCIEWAKNRSYMVSLIGILPISSQIDGVVQPSGSQRTNDRVRSYNSCLSQLAKKFDIDYFDFYKEFEKIIEECLDDGLHPNPTGHEAIATYMKAHLESLL